MNLNVVNEYDSLKKVFMTRLNVFKKESASVDNLMLEVAKGQNCLLKIFEKHGIECKHFSILPKHAYSMVFVRDPYFVVGDKFVLSRGCGFSQSRVKSEKDFFAKFFDINSQNIIEVPKYAVLDGGDVILHNDTIFVGQNGARTDKDGLEFMKRTFGEKFNIVPIEMTYNGCGGRVLHLDVVFNPVSLNDAICFTEGIKDKSLSALLDKFNILDIKAAEQTALATNVLNLGNNTLVSLECNERVNEELEKRNFVVEKAYFPAERSGGAFRCLSCPVKRM